MYDLANWFRYVLAEDEQNNRPEERDSPSDAFQFPPALFHGENASLSFRYARVDPVKYSRLTIAKKTTSQLVDLSSLIFHLLTD